MSACIAGVFRRQALHLEGALRPYQVLEALCTLCSAVSCSPAGSASLL